MPSVKPTFFAAPAALVLVAAWGVGCASSDRPRGATAAGAAGTSGAAAGTSGAAGDSTANPGAAGGPGAAGAVDPDPMGAARTGTPGTVPSGAGGTVDQGRLFTDAAVVSSAADDAGAASTPEASAAGDSGKTAPGDGNTSTCHVGGMSFVLVFTQKGTDVTMVVTATNCPAGNHTIQIHGGFSCDNAGTEGGVWDGMRGAGIPALACANNKGTLTYTRSGSDPTTSWTVGDHNTKTDVTLHPMSVDSSCGTFF
jgi:hypothetical protein